MKPAKNKERSIAGSLNEERKSASIALKNPEISLPKGGGAVKGIDEKFEVNPANGTASFSIPLPLSPGRHNFTPPLSLSYNSGNGNSAFGLGWQLNFPLISRKTDRGLPQYRRDAEEDVFTLSGVEDLVPVWDQGQGRRVVDRQAGPLSIRSFKPRIEGLFSRIERISGSTPEAVYWKVTDRNNVITFFGQNPEARVSDPEDAAKTFSWLPEFSFDQRGNWIQYEYQREDLTNIPALIHEKNRLNGQAPFTNIYLKRVKYGNRTPWYPDDAYQPTLPMAGAAYFFELVLDYGDHQDPNQADAVPAYGVTRSWDARPDPFSTYRSGFEIRTYRRCRRLLMFHHFADEQQFQHSGYATDFGEQYLVRSLELEYESAQAIAPGLSELSYLRSITQTGYIRNNGTYFRQSMPPMTFTYQEHEWNTEIKTVKRAHRPHAPAGLSANYQWIDLYGEGISGILTEQAGAWYYQSNLGNLEADGALRFSNLQAVVPKPTVNGLSNGTVSVQDLEANGKKQFVVHNPGLEGYFELSTDGHTEPFQPFKEIANIDLRDPNTRLLDLNGDGQAEIVMTEEAIFRWYPSRGKKGYGLEQHIPKPFDEELGPALLFSDPDQQEAVFLADMTGDGLIDIVRVRNGAICYWANKGYGRWSARISMHNSPRFDLPDAFDPQRLQIADISGTGPADLIYFGDNQFQVYFNLNGNAWRDARYIDPFFPVNDQTRLAVIDLLGTGTSCIVWSSGQLGHTEAPMRYIDLMNSKKPHVMKQYQNNLGAATHLEYKSSTYFYLKDKKAGKAWATSLPFPVQVISRKTVEDQITGARFTSDYRYHHGHYDHTEREFRGFGLVEQIDTEDYMTWRANTEHQLESARDLYQAPVLTKSWYHTGNHLSHDHYRNEYWQQVFARIFPEEALSFSEPELPQTSLVIAPNLADDPEATQLDGNGWRAMQRACKGRLLRREVFALDGRDELASQEARLRSFKPYLVTATACQVQLLQPGTSNDPPVFSVIEREKLDIHYERKDNDPRIVHSLNIRADELGNILESASVVYSRRQIDDSLPDETQLAQSRTLITYNERTFTNDVINDEVYRLRQVAGSRTFEIYSLEKNGILYQCSDFEQLLADGSVAISYHESPDGETVQRRLIEHLRTSYYNQELTEALGPDLIAGHGLPCESYQLAFTPELVSMIYGDKIDQPESLLGDAGKYVHLDGDQNWWIRSGRSLFVPDPDMPNPTGYVRDRFFSPFAQLSPFGQLTRTEYYRDYYLFTSAIQDDLNNRIEVEHFNFRSLSPCRIKDLNGNRSAVLLDELGRVKALALLGKGTEADQISTLTEYTTGQEMALLNTYFTSSDTDILRNTARALLTGAGTRFVYHPHRYRQSAALREEFDGNHPNSSDCMRPPLLPAVIGSIQREQFFAINPDSPIQLQFEFMDGLGQVAMSKLQAEPGEALRLSIAPDCNYTVQSIDTGDNLRWIGTGRTVLNNKGKPVKQYEPYFSETPFYEDHKELVERGVTPIIRYDALGRNYRTDFPNGTFQKNTFGAWQQISHDANDTVMESTWYTDRIGYHIDAELVAQGQDPGKERRAAELAAQHHATPSVQHLDTLGRPILQIDQNRSEETDAQGQPIELHDEYYTTRVEVDIEGNVRRLIDARGNTVMRYGYNLLGERVYEYSADAGEHWLLPNAGGMPISKWDSQDQVFNIQYDVLQRPVSTTLHAPDQTSHLIEKIVYGEDRSDAAAFNIRGAVWQHYDSSGLTVHEKYDLNGHLLEGWRQLLPGTTPPIVDWLTDSPDDQLDTEVFHTKMEYDALSRITRHVDWYRNADRVSITEPGYNERGLLVRQQQITAAQLTNDGYSGGRQSQVVSDIRYNEKGQRTQVRYGNDTRTRYYYDPFTARLTQLRTTLTAGSTLPHPPTNLSDPNVLQNLYYTYDPVGNITEIEDDAYEPVFFRNQQVEARSRYQYDALYRLIRAEGRENHTFNQAPGPLEAPPVATAFPRSDRSQRNYTQTYQYDPVGNILQMRHRAGPERWTRHYTYADDSNRLHQTWKGNNPVNAVTYQYDVHGNMLNYDQAPEAFLPQWDYRNMVYQLDLGGGGTARYQYDSERQRSRKTVERADGTSIERVYLGSMEIYRRRQGNTILEEIETHHLSLDGQRTLLIEEVLQTDHPHLTVGILDRYQYNNHLGSVGLELDGSGAILSYEEYHPFGTVAYRAVNTGITTTAKRYRYTGMERDEESGLNYHRARYYLPWLGRWFSPDPIGIEGGINVFAYAQNRPLSATDRSGKVTQEELPENIRPIDNKGTPRTVGQGDQVRLMGTDFQFKSDDPYGGFQEWTTLKEKESIQTISAYADGQRTMELMSGVITSTLFVAAAIEIYGAKVLHVIAEEGFSHFTGLPIGLDDLLKSPQLLRKGIGKLRSFARSKIDNFRNHKEWTEFLSPSGAGRLDWESVQSAKAWTLPAISSPKKSNYGTHFEAIDTAQRGAAAPHRFKNGKWEHIHNFPGIDDFDEKIMVATQHFATKRQGADLLNAIRAKINHTAAKSEGLTIGKVMPYSPEINLRVAVPEKGFNSISLSDIANLREYADVEKGIKDLFIYVR